MEKAESKGNPMLEPRIGKVVVNIAMGKSGEPLDKAMTVLQQLTAQRPCMRRAKRTIRTFGIRRNEPIACMVTLRGGRAEGFLRRSLEAVGNRIPRRSFGPGGFAFGIREHIDIPGTRYDPALGIIGMDLAVSVERPGRRVERRRRARGKVGRRQRVTTEEAAAFLKRRFGTEVEA